MACYSLRSFLSASVQRQLYFKQWWTLFCCAFKWQSCLACSHNVVAFLMHASSTSSVFSQFFKPFEQLDSLSSQRSATLGTENLTSLVTQWAMPVFAQTRREPLLLPHFRHQPTRPLYANFWNFVHGLHDCTRWQLLLCPSHLARLPAKKKKCNVARAPVCLEVAPLAEDSNACGGGRRRQTVRDLNVRIASLFTRCRFSQDNIPGNFSALPHALPRTFCHLNCLILSIS